MGWQHAPALGRDGGQTAMTVTAGRHKTQAVQGQARAHKEGMAGCSHQTVTLRMATKKGHGFGCWVANPHPPMHRGGGAAARTGGGRGAGAAGQRCARGSRRQPGVAQQGMNGRSLLHQMAGGHCCTRRSTRCTSSTRKGLQMKAEKPAAAHLVSCICAAEQQGGGKKEKRARSAEAGVRCRVTEYATAPSERPALLSSSRQADRGRAYGIAQQEAGASAPPGAERRTCSVSADRATTMGASSGGSASCRRRDDSMPSISARQAQGGNDRVVAGQGGSGGRRRQQQLAGVAACAHWPAQHAAHASNFLQQTQALTRHVDVH